LTPAPENFAECTVSVPNESDLAVLVGTISRLTRQSTIQNHASISNIYRQVLMHDDPGIKMVAVGPGTKGGCANDDELASLQKKLGWGYWKAHFAIYGPSPESVNASWAAVQKAFSHVPGAICSNVAYAGKDGAKIKARDTPEGEIPHNGFPRITALPVVNARGFGGGHIDFSPLFPAGGKELNAWYKSAKKLLQEAKFDFFADFHVYGRYIIAIIVVVYGPGEGPRANELFRRLLKDAFENHNATEYRTHIDYMDDVAENFNFGDGILKRFVTGLKEHIDPNGILSQGKSGIWNVPKSKAVEGE
jgi:4-cresol dehydrogenase (hydroxylating)